MRRSIARLVSVIALLAAVPAGAQPPSSTHAAGADKKAVAKAYVDAALVAHDHGDYDDAIELYRKAYALVPHPTLLFNMGQSHRLAGRRAEALALYRQYLGAVPTGELAAQARHWVEALEGELARDAAAQAEAARQKEARKAEAARRTTSVPRDVPPDVDEAPRIRPPGATPPIVESNPADDAGRTWRIAGAVAAGAGLGAVAAGSLFGLRARRLSNELSEHGAPYDPDKEAEGESADRTMLILCSVGGGLIIAGVTAYVLHRSDEAPVEAAVALTPDGVAVGAVGRF